MVEKFGIGCLTSKVGRLGRSNVGKSSLLNALTRQWGVVRTSDKPGLTQVMFLTVSPNGLNVSLMEKY